jgi:general secretion pathway protein E
MTKRFSDPLSAQFVLKVLHQKGLISAEQAESVMRNKSSAKERLEKAKVEEYRSSGRIKIETPVTIIDIILSLGLKKCPDQKEAITEEELYLALAGPWGFPYKKIDPLSLDLHVVTSTIPRSFAMKHLMLPIDLKEKRLTVATSNPFNTEAIDDIARAGQLQVDVVVSAKNDILKLIDEFFGFKRSILKAENQFSTPSVDLGNLEQLVRLKAVDELPSDDQHIVNAVNHLLSYAFDQRASDIHIEPKREKCVIRMRIDGVLHTVYDIPKKVHNAIVSRIKAMSRLDMAEKRRPQDGRIKTGRDGVEVDIRVSTIPVVFGEKVVMRLLDPDILFKDLKELGFSPFDLERYRRIIQNPHGIILVCGPTGSGKSTTLYSSLRELATPDINITTVEDPVEMIYEGFNQIAVQPAIDVTFSSILRNILRQDPDIIMIGEMRDLDTARNAVQAALTGHLVFSTLHTNDSVSSIIRLLDLGIPSFLIQSSLVGVASQRLLRKVCVHCAEKFEMDADQLKACGINTGKQGTVQLVRGRGCMKCRGTGFFGRTAIFEVLPYTDSLKALTTPTTDIDGLSLHAEREGLVSLRQNAILKMVSGETTYEEVLRVTWDNQNDLS